MKLNKNDWRYISNAISTHLEKLSKIEQENHKDKILLDTVKDLKLKYIELWEHSIEMIEKL